jgi:hypothetical protein
MRFGTWNVMSLNLDLREIGWGGMEWIHLARDRDQWSASALWTQLVM